MGGLVERLSGRSRLDVLYLALFGTEVCLAPFRLLVFRVLVDRYGKAAFAWVPCALSELLFVRFLSGLVVSFAVRGSLATGDTFARVLIAGKAVVTTASSRYSTSVA